MVDAALMLPWLLCQARPTLTARVCFAVQRLCLDQTVFRPAGMHVCLHLSSNVARRSLFSCSRGLAGGSYYIEVQCGGSSRSTRALQGKRRPVKGFQLAHSDKHLCPPVAEYTVAYACTKHAICPCKVYPVKYSTQQYIPFFHGLTLQNVSGEQLGLMSSLEST
jgi:hypothetical protein